jgi:hypothetical protein
MICYKDMTFCDYYKDCQDGDTCFRALTPEIRKRGKEWSETFGAEEELICRFDEEPSCFIKKEKQNGK